MYANETILLAESGEDLQDALSAMFIYCNTWKLQVNVSLLRKSRTLALAIDIQLQLFHTLVTPVVMYGEKAWGIEDCTVIERLH